MRSILIGIGLMGTNLVNCAMRTIKGCVSYLTINDDSQVNDCSCAEHKILLLSANTTDELDNVRIDTSTSDKVWSMIFGYDAVFVVFGAAGHLASDIMSDLVKILNKTNAYKMCIPVMPFLFEGMKRNKHAEKSISCLEEYFDAVHIISNENESAEYRRIKNISGLSELLTAIDAKITRIIISEIEQRHSII